jgi:hypothetical protein
VGELLPGRWEDRGETDEERWLRELLAWVEEYRGAHPGTGRVITLHLDIYDDQAKYVDRS